MTLEEMVGQLQRSKDYRVLRRFVPRRVYTDIREVRRPRMGLFVDVETTGFDPETDEIIQLAALPFVFETDPEGGAFVVQADDSFVWLEEPKNGIPADIVDLTGITPDMVRGKSIDVEAVEMLFAGADIVIAHQAEFDRPRIERRIGGDKLASVPWACSLNEVNWTRHYGATAKSLGAALAAVGEFTDDAHDALEDCQVGLHVLATAKRECACPRIGVAEDMIGDPDCRFCNGSGVVVTTAFNDLLASARRSTFRLFVAFPFDDSGRLTARLKARRYRWSDGRDDKPKAWFRDVRSDDVEAERAWLLQVIPGAHITFTKYGARDRYSARV